MAKGKSLGKNKSGESAVPSRKTPRKKNVESPAPSVAVKELKTTKKNRVRKTKTEGSETVDPVDSQKKKPIKSVVASPKKSTTKTQSTATGDVPQAAKTRVVSRSKKQDDVEVVPVRRTARRKSNAVSLEVVVKKSSSSQKTDEKSEKKRARKPKSVEVVEPALETKTKPSDRKSRKKPSPVESIEKNLKSTSKKDAAPSKSPAPAETKPSEVKTKHGRRSRSPEPVSSESEASPVEKPKTKQRVRRSVEVPATTALETKLESEPSRPKRKRARKSEEQSDAEKPEALETSVDVVAPKRKRAKETDDGDVENRRDAKPGRDRVDSETSLNVDDAVATPELQSEPNAEENDEKSTSDDSVKKDAAPRDKKSKASSESSRRRSAGIPRRVLQRQSPDYLQLSVVNSFWICAQWIVSDANLSRVRSAMGRLWHTAEPILRVYRVDKSPRYTTMRRDRIADVVVQLPVRIWYVPVDNPPGAFMVELGYLSRDKEFFTLASSGVVETSAQFINDPSPLPPPLAPHWGVASSIPHKSFESSNADRSQESLDDSDVSLRRDDSANYLAGFGGVSLKVGAEIIVKGRVSPGAVLRIRDERVVPKPNGIFAVRLELPERRHVFPVVATSYDGSETQTIILAVDRNTKTLETVFRDDDE